MTIQDAVTAIAALGMLVAVLLGLIALINPRWFGISTRLRSSMLLFGIAFACLITAVAASSPSADELADPSAVTETGYVALRATPTGKVSTQVTYRDISILQDEYAALTDLQRKEWTEKHEWSYWVAGECIVSDVEETSIFSEIDDAAFEVTCELGGNNRAVLYFHAEGREYVLTLNKGDPIEFQGHLKNMKDWGFWITSYVLIESQYSN